MNMKPNIDILEATRLTREGRLAEALAILQGKLPSSHSSPASSTAGGNVRIPMKPDAYSKVKPDIYSVFIPDSVPI
jgi:hypothetical protein